jgi:gluconolactonase
MTNVEYGGPGWKSLFMTAADSGAVLLADLDVPGHPMYSHLDWEELPFHPTY